MKQTDPMALWLFLAALLPLSPATATAQEGFDITAVARLGDPVVGPPTLVSASDPQLNDAGDVLFRGDGGLLLTWPDGLLVVAAPGDVSPDGRFIASIGQASANALGQVAFVASLDPSGTALLLFSDGAVPAIAESGDTVTGGGAFVSFGSPALNGQGHPGVVRSAGYAVSHWQGQVGRATVVMDEGDQPVRGEFSIP